MRQLQIGSMFSGYGGLDIAVEEHFSARTAWFAEFEDAPSAILERHWPGTPNLRDVTTIDWDTVPRVDILTGGFPCQDVSLAGRRAGMTEGTRSNLWGAMRTAIEKLRPRFVVAENVRGLLSAKATSELESCPGCVGDTGDGEHFMRALGRVLGDLADLGYDAKWYGLRAADVGAPHGRFRVFIVATDTELLRGATGRIATPGQASGRESFSEPLRRDRTQATTDTEHDGQSAGQDRGGNGAATTSRRRAGRVTEVHDGQLAGGHSVDGRSDDVRWGAYESAIRRWENILDRPSPPPTQLTERGNHRLSPVFVEWMMGLPEGWVTDIDISRADQIKALGNGVVPQQALAALRAMVSENEIQEDGLI